MEELVALATHLAEADDRLRAALIRARQEADLSQADVAELLGIKQSSVAAFERQENDPRLSTIRRYALAVGATIDHRVTCGSWSSGWTPVTSPRPSVEVMRRDLGPQTSVMAPADSKRTDFAMAA